MKTTLAKFNAAACVLALSTLALWVGWCLFLNYYESMHAYHLDGLPAILLLSLAIATVATPFFSYSLSQGPGDAPENAKQTFQLYSSVLAITFGAFSLVLFGLWILGWLRVLLYIIYRALIDLMGLG